MSKAGRIKLGKEWKHKLLENQKGARWVIPKQVKLDHPYILEADAEGKQDPQPKSVDKQTMKKGEKLRVKI